MELTHNSYNSMGLLPRPGGWMRRRSRRRSRSPRVVAIRAAEGRPWRSASAALKFACAPCTAMTSVPLARLFKLVFERKIGVMLNQLTHLDPCFPPSWLRVGKTVIPGLQSAEFSASSRDRPRPSSLSSVRWCYLLRWPPHSLQP
jgi:hypothetical protein